MVSVCAAVAAPGLRAGWLEESLVCAFLSALLCAFLFELFCVLHMKLLYLPFLRCHSSSLGDFFRKLLLCVLRYII